MTVANAIFLPINYALELGFFLAVGVLRLRQLVRGRIEASANELAAWTLVMTSFLIGTFLRSSTISSNDLGWRCFLPAQLILLLWGATMVHDWWFHRSTVAPQPAPHPWARGALAMLLILGILGTAYQVFMLRMFPVLLDRGLRLREKAGWIRTGSSANGHMRCGQHTKFSMRNCLLRQSCRAIHITEDPDPAHAIFRS